MNDKSQEKIIFLLGPLLSSQYDRDSIRAHTADFTVFIDAAVQFREELELPGPSFALGDGDGPQHQADYKELLDQLYPKEKDQSDLALALEYVGENLILKNQAYHYSIEAHGLWGERLDHQLSNFGEIANWLQNLSQEITFKFIEGNETLAIIKKGKFSFNYNGSFSVFSLIENTQIKIEGKIKYPIDSTFTVLSSLGLSNEAHGEVTLQSAAPVIIIFPEKSNQQV